MRITVTRKGFDLVEEAVAAHVEGEERLLDGISSEDRRHLAELLGKLLASMETPRGADARETSP